MDHGNISYTGNLSLKINPIIVLLLVYCVRMSTVNAKRLSVEIVFTVFCIQIQKMYKPLNMGFIQVNKMQIVFRDK